MKLSDKKVLTIGFGMFEVFFAQRFAEDFKESLLYIPYESPFPVPDKEYIGKGIPGITLVDEPEDHEGEIDLYVFLDYGFMGRQRALRKKGKKVFGAGEAEEYERDREKAYGLLARCGLPVPPHKMVTGVDELRNALKNEKEVKWIKIPPSERGIIETWKHESYEKSCRFIDKMGLNAGILRDSLRIAICDDIPGVEFGVEKFLSAGRYAPIACYGPEIKSAGYLGHVMSMNEMPLFLRRIDDGLAPEWRRLKVSGHISSEIRTGKDKKPYFGDFCQRQGSPPGEAICNAYKNISHLFYAAAVGEELKPEKTGNYVAEVCVYSRLGKEQVLPVSFPKKQSNNLKFRRLCRMKDQYYVLPDKDSGDRIGAAVGVGETREEAEFMAMEVVESLECEGKEYSKTVFEDVDDVLREAKKYGLMERF